MYLLGYDIGSSAVKAALVDAATGRAVATATSPDEELAIHAARPDWAEQAPDTWWQHVVRATQQLLAKTDARGDEVEAIGLSYQMHGLVALGPDGEPLRPAIIWCDSRAVDIGRRAFRELGPERCLQHLLGSPGNFTASKLRWMREEEPERFRQIDKALLPGDYIAYRMTGRAVTTRSGLSEMALWDYQHQQPAQFLLDYYELPATLLPERVPTFGEQGRLTQAAARALSLAPGTPVTYRAGDQPNNAFSLGALAPGELAATAGTSGVIYAVHEEAEADPKQRVNTFVHVNHTRERPRYGVLMCVNGAGILYRWLRQQVADSRPYEAMNERARQAPPGAEGLLVLPYGNGAERTLGNRNLGASIHALRFPIHEQSHLLRAAQEGIAFALHYGLGALREGGLSIDTVRAGRTNLFLSPLFATTFATVTGATLDLLETDGAQGAARGAGVGVGIYASPEEACAQLQPVETIYPDDFLRKPLRQAYARWKASLHHAIKQDTP